MEEKLAEANIPVSWWPNCYVAEDGAIFTPAFDDAGGMIKTGEQVHQDWITTKNQPVITTPAPQDIINANIMARLATLEGVSDV